MDHRIGLLTTPQGDIKVAVGNPLGDLDWGTKVLDSLNLGASDAQESIKVAVGNPLGDLDWITKVLDSLNLGASDAQESIKIAVENPLGDLDWGTKVLDSLNLGASDALDSIKVAVENPLGDLDWSTKVLDSLNLGASDAQESIKIAVENPLGDLDWVTKVLDSLNLGASDAQESIKIAVENPLGDLDWGTKVLDSLNLGVLGDFDAIVTAALHPPTEGLVNTLNWRTPWAMPEVVYVHPERPQTVQMPHPPERGPDVGHRNDHLRSFDNQITCTGLVRYTRALFADGHYSVAVEKALVYVENLVKQQSRSSDKHGSSLMTTVFSVHNPLIRLNAGITDSDRDEQIGYMGIFAGVMTGIRNPRAHSHNWVDEPETALELLVMANHLARKILMAASSQNSK